RGGTAGAGVALAVDLVDIAGALDVGKALHEAGAVLPVNGAAVAFELAGLGEQVGADRKRAQRPAAPAPVPERAEHLRLAGKLGRQPDGDEKDVNLRDAADAVIDLERYAVRGHHRLAIGRNRGPAVEIAAQQTVGRAERVARG